jgi:hypothetical protein
MILELQTKLHRVENRRFQRVPVSLFGRYMLESKTEYPCQTIQMSPGDMWLFAPVKPQIGEKVIVYLDELGRFAGAAVRQDMTAFAMTINLSELKRDKLADQLTWFANRHEIGLPEDRRHERVVPLMHRANLTLPDNREVIVKIIDISISGVSVETETLPPLGSRILVGATPAVVVRHFSGGFGGEFPNLFAPGHIDESTRL